MSDHLHWTRSGETFVAYPEGDRLPNRVALLTPASGSWNWSVEYDRSRTGAVAATLQEASDSANVAWPLVKAHALRAAERNRWENRQLALLDQAQAGKVAPEAFNLGAADYDDLDWIIARAFKRPDSPGIERLIDAISQELSKRRTK